MSSQAHTLRNVLCIQIYIYTKYDIIHIIGMYIINMQSDNTTEQYSCLYNLGKLFKLCGPHFSSIYKGLQSHVWYLTHHLSPLFLSDLTFYYSPSTFSTLVSLAFWLVLDLPNTFPWGLVHLLFLAGRLLPQISAWLKYHLSEAHQTILFKTAHPSSCIP